MSIQLLPVRVRIRRTRVFVIFTLSLKTKIDRIDNCHHFMLENEMLLKIYAELVFFQ
jgi:hypothetical protein